MKKIIILLLSIGIFKVSLCCPPFYFHVTHNGSTPLTFAIENVNNPFESIQVVSTPTPDGRYSVSAQGFNGTLSHPCGVVFGSNTCYKIKCTTGPANADYLVVKFNGLNPNGAIFDYDVTTGIFNIRPGYEGNASAYTYSIGNPTSISPLCANCYELAAIFDNYLNNDGVVAYPAPITQLLFFNSPYIETNGVIVVENTTIAATSIVRFDANPLNGSIHLYPGFSTEPGAIFIAQPLDGCGPLIPN